MGFWTAFTFKGYAPTEMHCTHKYLGGQPMPQVEQIQLIISEYFSQPRTFPRVRADKVEYFGAGKNIRVLTPTQFDPGAIFPDLREQLNAFRPDDYGDYIPHITTKVHEIIDLNTDGYVLMFGSEVVQYYKR